MLFSQDGKMAGLVTGQNGWGLGRADPLISLFAIENHDNQ